MCVKLFYKMNRNTILGLLAFTFVSTCFLIKHAHSPRNRERENKNLLYNPDLSKYKHAKLKTGDRYNPHIPINTHKDHYDVIADDIRDGRMRQEADDFDAMMRRNKTTDDQRWFRWLDNPGLPDNDRHNYKNVEERLLSRRAWTSSACRHMKKLKLVPPNQQTYEREYRKHYIVNEDKQFLFCYLPKVANTNFRRVFLAMLGVISKEQMPLVSGYEVYFKYDESFTYLKEFGRTKEYALIKENRKFMIVRDPFERLLSGYRNKFFHPNPEHTAEFHGKVRSFYIEHTELWNRKGIRIRVDFTNQPLTFEEFLVYVVDTYETGAYLNEHFTASNQLCDPCRTNIDFIAKYDSLYDDVDFIFKELNIDIEFPGRNDNYDTKKTNTLEEEYYRKIPTWLLLKVWDILKYDYLLFGFSLPQWFKERINV